MATADERTSINVSAKLGFEKEKHTNHLSYTLEPHCQHFQKQPNSDSLS